VTLDPGGSDVVAEIKRLTEGRGVDVAIEALGRQETFETALRAFRARWDLIQPRRVFRETGCAV
jgi:threonine dehydrogenase-like Zn-dependent dehydrogenase